MHNLRNRSPNNYKWLNDVDYVRWLQQPIDSWKLHLDSIEFISVVSESPCVSLNVFCKNVNTWEKSRKITLSMIRSVAKILWFSLSIRCFWTPCNIVRLLSSSLYNQAFFREMKKYEKNEQKRQNDRKGIFFSFVYVQARYSGRFDISDGFSVLFLPFFQFVWPHIFSKLAESYRIATQDKLNLTDDSFYDIESMQFLWIVDKNKWMHV